MSDSQIIYVSNIHSSLAFHIIETLRNDHLHLSGYRLFVGSSQGSSSQRVHQSVTKVYNIEQESILFCRVLLQCSVFVLDLDEIGGQLQLAIRSIQERGRSNMPTKVIGLSSYMTWSNSRPAIQNLERRDKEQVLRILKQSCKFNLSEQKHFSAEDYQERRPSHLFQTNYRIQNMLLELNKNQNTQATVICSGLIYGKNFPEKWLHQKLAAAYNQEHMVCWGSGNNYVPLVHIDKLLSYINYALEQQKSPVYCIAVNNVPERQIDIVRSLQKYSGNLRSIQFKQLENESLAQILFSTNLVLKPFLTVEEDDSTLEKYLSECGQEIHEWLEITPLHAIIDFEGIESWQEWKIGLGQYCKVYEIGEEEMQLKKNESEHLSEEQILEDQYFGPLERCHYIIVISKNISISVQTLRKYNIVRLTDSKDCKENQVDINSPEGWQKLRIQMPNIFAHQSKSLNSHQKEEEDKSNIEIEQPLEEDDSHPKQEHKSVEESEQQEKQREETDKKTSKIDQYILDNVTPYLAEAYFQRKGDLTLSSLIESLKQIYDREMKEFLDD